MKGNQTRKFLKKLDHLELALKDAGYDVLQRGLPFVDLLRAFSEVVDVCFSTQLKGDPLVSILDFKRRYLDLGISVTPKVNIVYGLRNYNFNFRYT